MFTSLLFVMLTVAACLEHEVRAQTSCSIAYKNSLNDCGLPIRDLGNGPIQISFEPFIWSVVPYPKTNPKGVSILTERLKFADATASESEVLYFGLIKAAKGDAFDVTVKTVSGDKSNLHPHGLHVSGNDDDTSRSISGVNEELRYNYPIPSDSNGGLFWIHPHVMGKSVAHVGGGALGLLDVKDDGQSKEVPGEIASMTTIHVILHLVNPSVLQDSGQLQVSDVSHPQFFSVNGLVDNPKLFLYQSVWIRVKMLYTNEQSLLTLEFSDPLKKGKCQFALLAKDGVYLASGPRIIRTNTAGTTRIYMSQAQRLDLAVRCDGPANQVIQAYRYSQYETPQKINVFKITIRARPSSIPASPFQIQNAAYMPCLPKHLQDLRGAIVAQDFDISLPFTGVTINGQAFKGFDATYALVNFTRDAVVQFTVTGQGDHPMHFHVVHVQAQTDSSDGWTKAGDWVDTFALKNFAYRARMDLPGRVMMHCHSLIHQQQGMAATYWIYGTSPGQTDVFGVDVCASKVFLPCNAYSSKSACAAQTSRCIWKVLKKRQMRVKSVETGVCQKF